MELNIFKKLPKEDEVGKRFLNTTSTKITDKNRNILAGTRMLKNTSGRQLLDEHGNVITEGSDGSEAREHNIWNQG